MHIEVKSLGHFTLDEETLSGLRALCDPVDEITQRPVRLNVGSAAAAGQEGVSDGVKADNIPLLKKYGFHELKNAFADGKRVLELLEVPRVLVDLFGVSSKTPIEINTNTSFSDFSKAYLAQVVRGTKDGTPIVSAGSVPTIARTVALMVANHLQQDVYKEFNGSYEIVRPRKFVEGELVEGES